MWRERYYVVAWCLWRIQGSKDGENGRHTLLSFYLFIFLSHGRTEIEKGGTCISGSDYAYFIYGDVISAFLVKLLKLFYFVIHSQIL